MSSPQHPVTPDGRYFVVRRRLWRRSDPALTPEDRQALVDALMAARRTEGAADLNRRMLAGTSYAAWHGDLTRLKDES